MIANAGNPAPAARAARRPPLDPILSLAAAVTVFAVYVKTMYPGIFDGGDPTKFAFVGRILGIPHAPGYPLYVMVSHVFSYLPWGTLAHRMNGMSALFGAMTVALLYAATRTVGAGRLAAFASALALGFGRSFWSRAIYSKTYTLNSAIVTLGVVLLFRWGITRRRSHLYLAIAVFALSIGNHLIVVSLVPALIAYAIAVDRHQALSWRTIAFTIAAVAVSFCQYLLIIVRTLQRAPYLEARATNLSELVDVITARRWSYEIGAYSGHALLAKRVPIVDGLVRNELTTAGLVLAAAGLVILFRRKWREAMLCSLAALGVLTLTANMSSNEDQGFLLPAFVLLWLFAGVALDAIVRFILSWRQRGISAVPSGAAALGCASVMPLLLLVHNYGVNDRHAQTYDIRYFDALFDMLPARAAIVNEVYTVDMMLQYKLLGEDAARGRTIDLIRADHAAVAGKLAQGFQVFAFGEARDTLETFGYRFAPVALKEPGLSGYLTSVPVGSTVVFASTSAAAPLLHEDRRAWRRIGENGDALFGGRESLATALVGVAGTSRAAWNAGPLSASLSILPNGPIGGSGAAAPAAIQAGADATVARVVVNGREEARSDGAVIATVDHHGRTTAVRLDTRDGLRVPLDMAPLSLYQLTGVSTCRDIGNAGWQDLSALDSNGTITLRIDNYRAFLSKTTFYVAGSQGARATLTAVMGVGTPAIGARTFDSSSAADRAALTSAARADQAKLPAAFFGAAVVSRIELDVNDKGAYSAVHIGFGMVPSAIYGRSIVDLDNPRRSTVCAPREMAASPSRD